MGTVQTLFGGEAYAAPVVEIIEVTAEKGFAGSTEEEVPGSGGIEPLGASYDDFYTE